MIYSYQLTSSSGSNGPFTIYESDKQLAVNVRLPYVVKLTEWKPIYTFRLFNTECNKMSIQTVSGYSTTTTTLFVGTLPTGSFTTVAPPIIPSTTFTTREQMVPITTIFVRSTVNRCVGDVSSVDYGKSVICDFYPSGNGVSGQYQLRIESTSGTVIRDWDYNQPLENGKFTHTLDAGEYHIFLRDTLDQNTIAKQLFFSAVCPVIPTTTSTTTTRLISNKVNVFLTVLFVNGLVRAKVFLMRDGDEFKTDIMLTIEGKLFFSDTNGSPRTAALSFTLYPGQSTLTNTMPIVGINSQGYLESCLSNITPNKYGDLTYELQTKCFK